MSTAKLFQNFTFTAGIVSLASFGGLALTATPSHAVQVNFSTWTKFGDVSTPGGQANLSTDNNLYQDDFPAPKGAFNFSGQPAGDGAGPLQTFLGLGSNSTALDIGGTALEGSAIKSTYVAQAGDKFSFNYNFLTNEGLNNDFAFFLVNNTVTKLADVTNASIASNPFLKATGSNFFSYTFNTAGTYTLALGVVDVNDYTVSSALQLSNGNIQPVPEPMTMLGSVTALGFGTGMLRRVRKKEQAKNI